MVDLSLAKTITLALIALAIICVHLFLSFRKNAVFAFILPSISFVVSVVAVIMYFPSVSAQNYGDAILQAVKIFLRLNVPTLVLALSAVMARILRNKM